jgi:hypothetical protein
LPVNEYADRAFAARLEALGAGGPGGDWDDVRRRADTFRARRRTRHGALLALAAALVGAVAVAPALGVHLPLIDFYGSEPAPAHVQQEFATLDAAAPIPEWRTGVIADQTRKVTDARFAGVEHTLYVAPTTKGGLCTTWSEGPGGCDRLGTVPLDVTWGAQSSAAADYVVGFAHSRWVDSVEIRLGDGRSLEPHVTWVGDPIDAGFFAYDTEAGQRIDAVIARDRDGNVVTDQTLLGPRQVPPADALVDRKREALSVDTPVGRAVIWTAPTRYDGECSWLEVAGNERSVAPCTPEGYGHDGVGASLVRAGSDELFVASVGLGVTSAELRYADGDSQTVDARSGFVLVDVPAPRVSGEHRLKEIVMKRADGSQLPPFDADEMTPAG